ncbi:hypothetical protein [Solibacillus daqui]|uniref:hypothetical protein n=1 Tax=Solibacillus daqui TaxID=2912187 RepID=UPI002366516F|nr:hypothetical protein [Solibacillus daqui]
MERLNNRSKTAKLNRKLFFKFGNGTIDISKSALSYMFYTITFIGKDGRIFCDADMIRTALLFQHKTYNRVIEELKGLGLLVEVNNQLYSRFHVLSDGEKTDSSYIRNLAIFTSPEVASLTKNQKRFFIYIATAGLLTGPAQYVSVESLYSNKYHNGVNYIESYHDLNEILSVLVGKGLIDVQIDGKFYDKNSPDFEVIFHAYCNYNKITRKQRMSKKRTHRIGLRVHLPLLNKANVVPNTSSHFEIEMLAINNYISPKNFREDTIHKFVGIQNDLFKLFGVNGIKIYREALVTYFEKEQLNILYYDQFADPKTTKAINTMVDFYLLPNVQQLIVQAASVQEPTNELDSYFAEKENLVKLVHYFNSKSSDNHKVLLDEQLELCGVDLQALVAVESNKNRTESAWFALHEQVELMYNHARYDENIVSIGYQKRVIRQWAKEGILSRKELLKQVIEKLHAKLTFIPLKTSIPNVPTLPIVSNEQKLFLQVQRNIEESRKKFGPDYEIPELGF